MRSRNAKSLASSDAGPRASVPRLSAVAIVEYFLEH